MRDRRCFGGWGPRKLLARDAVTAPCGIDPHLEDLHVAVDDPSARVTDELQGGGGVGARLFALDANYSGKCDIADDAKNGDVAFSASFGILRRLGRICRVKRGSSVAFFSKDGIRLGKPGSKMSGRSPSAV